MVGWRLLFYLDYIFTTTILLLIKKAFRKQFQV